VAGTVDDSDIIRFDASSLGQTTAGTFLMYFDGSDVGLSSSGEDVDAFELLASGALLVSAQGSVSVPGASGADEDLLAFTPSSLGPTTSGTFALYFDGSDVGLTSSGENVDAAAVDAAGRIYLSTTGNFSVTGVSGPGHDHQRDLRPDPLLRRIGLRTRRQRRLRDRPSLGRLTRPA